MWMFSGYGMGAAGWLVMALFWIALIALVVFAVIRLFPARTEPTAQPRERGEEPREILKRRLASGEIDVDAYEQLSSKLGPPSPAARG
jgi:putative membrane protein